MRTASILWTLALLAALALFPLVAPALGLDFYISFVRRVLIYALAATSLNLILGYGGMVALGHAAFFGAGAYAVGILAMSGVTSALVSWPVAMLLAALLAFITGAISLRTRGVYFIMITLAFAQMFYFLATGLEGFGGDDGMSLFAGSDFGLFRLDTPLALYYTAFGVLLLALAALRRLVQAPFGMVLRGCQANERRMRALGFATLRYRLAAYVLSAMVCGVAGVLLANLTLYVSPSYLAWTTSGELIVMVALGGLGTVVGPLAGALAFLLLEEGLKLLTDHWMLVMGLLIVGVVLVSRRGLYGGLSDKPLRLGAARALPHPTGEPR